MAVLNFDSSTVEPQADFEPLPAGEYMMHVKNSEMKDTKAGTGQYLQITLEVLEGQAKNRLVFDRMNLKNPNPTAVQIGQQHLSSLCLAIGVVKIENSEQLHGKPVLVRLSVRPGKDGYDATNEVKGFKAASGATPAPIATRATGTDSAAPWNS